MKLPLLLFFIRATPIHQNVQGHQKFTYIEYQPHSPGSKFLLGTVDGRQEQFLWYENKTKWLL